ncbi:MAG: hypothetical protein J1G38_00725 [Clostridiales bacterium]|nr:hypothetical protein [Clostridiales bacterium]
MKFIITRDMTEVDYKSFDFWQQVDEIEVEEPSGWYIRYVEGGIVHTFDYDQSSGRREYIDEYREDVFKVPLGFTADAKVNAEIMRKVSYDGKKAKLIREP